MPASEITLSIKDSLNVDRSARFMSSDGLATGLLSPIQTLDATQLAALASQTTLAAVLTKLSADPATQTTLAAVQALLAGNLNAVAPAPTTGAVTIAAGQSLSDAVQVDGKLVGLIVPAAWTTAAITFAGSPDGGTYYPIFDDGTERTVSSAAVVAGRFLALPLSDWLGVKYLKVRSGTSGTPVTQGAARAVTIVRVA